jgi:hypothetical protein
MKIDDKIAHKWSINSSKNLSEKIDTCVSFSYIFSSGKKIPVKLFCVKLTRGHDIHIDLLALVEKNISSLRFTRLRENDSWSQSYDRLQLQRWRFMLQDTPFFQIWSECFIFQNALGYSYILLYIHILRILHIMDSILREFRWHGTKWFLLCH